jgi:AcrR family transcriptional regulator
MATQTEPRLPLNRDRILRRALELVDEGGIEALTMRKLGQALGFEAMSLYNHVANKDDVIAGILELVLEETEPPSPDGDWRSSIRQSAVSVYDALRRHPWASPLLMSPSRVTEPRLVYMDTLLERLRQGGFSADTTYHAYHALDGHIFGFSMWQAGHSLNADNLPVLAQAFLKEHPLDDYPYLLEHANQHMNPGPLNDVRAFEFALDLILDGLEKLRG